MSLEIILRLKLSSKDIPFSWKLSEETVTPEDLIQIGGFFNRFENESSAHNLLVKNAEIAFYTEIYGSTQVYVGALVLKGLGTQYLHALPA